MNTKRNQDTCKARTRFFIAFLAVCAVMILADKANAQQPHWAQSPTITYEVESVTGPVQIAVEYAAWSLSQRTGLDIQPAGFGPAGVNGTIHVRVVNALEAFEAGVGFSAVGYVIPWTYTETGEIARAEFNILENEADELTDMLVRIAVHEMGHAVGIRGHSADTRDVMFAVIGPDYRYTLASGDIALLSPEYSVNRCFSELDMSGNAYVPAIEGYGAELITTGAGTFTLGSVSDPGETCSGAITGSVVTLYDVRSMDGRYRVELDMLGPDFTLLSAQDYGSAQVKARSARAAIQWPDGEVVKGRAIE